MTALIIGLAEEAQMADLRKLAEAHPVNMGRVVELLRTEEGKAEHMRQMQNQTIQISEQFDVTYSIEEGHPAGTCRHLSVSMAHGIETSRVPHPLAIWMIAEYFGFVGSLERCVAWQEDFRLRGRAINVVQPLEMPAGTF